MYGGLFNVIRYGHKLNHLPFVMINADGYLQGETDEERPGELYRYNNMGWLTESRKPVKTGEDGTVYYQLTQYRYDLAGNMTRGIRYRDYQTGTGETGTVHAISYEYDRNNRRTRVSDSTGASIEYRYDSANRRISEKRRINDTTEQTLYVDERATNSNYSFNTASNPSAFYNIRNGGLRWIASPSENE